MTQLQTELKPIQLWPGRDPDEDDGQSPTLVPMLIETDHALPMVVVLPGGGYGNLADHEGKRVASRMNDAGLHAAVLYYRIARNRHPKPLNDAQRAMRLIRANAKNWQVDPQALAILGFSAGGHLASSLLVHADHDVSPEDDLAETYSAQVQAGVLCYPVIDMGEYAHGGSRNNLLGEQPDPHLLEQMSTWRQVTNETPPTFLWHTADDPAVPVENSLRFAEACRKHHVPTELHVYESGRHGLGLATEETNGIEKWSDLAVGFLKRHLL